MLPEKTLPVPSLSVALEKLPAFPLTEWEYIRVKDLRDKKERCPCCRRQTFRFGHILEHSDWPEPIRVGCVCAGRLTGDEEAPVRMQKVEERISKITENFFSAKWQDAGLGGIVAKVGRFKIQIMQCNGVFKFRLNDGPFCSDPSGNTHAVKMNILEELHRHIRSGA